MSADYSFDGINIQKIPDFSLSFDPQPVPIDDGGPAEGLIFPLISWYWVTVLVPLPSIEGV